METKLLSRLQPLQIDTVIMGEKTYLRGKVNSAVNVVGTTLAGLITVKRNNDYAFKMPNGRYRVEVITNGSSGTYKVIDLENGTETAPITVNAAENKTLIAGVSIKITTLEGCTNGDYAEFTVIGDSTSLKPGTIVGKLNDESHPHHGKYVVATNDILSKLSSLRVMNGYVETDKSITIAPIMNDINLSKNFATSVIVFGMVDEEICKAKNLTDEMKAKIQGIVWA